MFRINFSPPFPILPLGKVTDSYTYAKLSLGVLLLLLLIKPDVGYSRFPYIELQQYTVSLGSFSSRFFENVYAVFEVTANAYFISHKAKYSPGIAF